MTLLCARLAGVLAGVALAAGCATVQPPHGDSLHATDPARQDCARWFQSLDAAVARAGVTDIAARRVDGFPYLRVDRFVAALGETLPRGDVADVKDGDATEAGTLGGEDARFDAWFARMRTLDNDGRRVEVDNLPDAVIGQLGVAGRGEVLQRTGACADTLAAADLEQPAQTRALLAKRARVADDYSTWQRALGLYPLLQLPFSGGIDDWHAEAIDTFERARAGEAMPHPVLRYVPAGGLAYTREEVAALLARERDPLGIPLFSADERARLFVTYAPVLEVETSGEYDRVGRLVWSDSPYPQVDASRPTLYRKLTYTRFAGQTLLQLVYVAWMGERPKDGRFDLLGGHLDGIIWRVTLSAEGEPLLFDTIHPCGCFHMFFPTPRVIPVAAPDPYIEWAFSPADLPSIEPAQRVVVSMQTRTHYLRNVWPGTAADGIEYGFADYDALRTLPLPGGGSRSAFGSDGLVPGTERGERFLFWPMGISSAGAMRQWGAHATAFIGRRHFDDADLIERRFQLVDEVH